MSQLVIAYEYQYNKGSYLGLTDKTEINKKGIIPIRYSLIEMTRDEISFLIDLKDQDPKQFLHEIRQYLKEGLTIYNN